jgi:hypothetical protein
MLDRLTGLTRLQMRGRMTPRMLSLGHQLRAYDGDVARGIDPQPHLSSLESNDGDANVLADEKLLHELSGQHEHEWLPFQNPDASLSAQVEMMRYARLRRDESSGSLAL